MNWLRKTYRTVADHLGKILSGIGATFLSLDLAGYAGQIKEYAAQYLGEQPAKKVGLVLFVLLLIRTWYTGWKAQQEKASLPPPDPNAARP